MDVLIGIACIAGVPLLAFLSLALGPSWLEGQWNYWESDKWQR